MKMPTLKELIDKRARLNKEMDAVVNKADAENRSLNGEESALWDTMDADFKVLDKDIERRQKIQERETAMSAPSTEVRSHRESGNGNGEGLSKLSTEEQVEAENRAFDAWLRNGLGGITPEQRAIMHTRRARNFDASDLPRELRAQAVGTGSAGGFAVPQGFSGEVEKDLEEFGGVREAARIFPTASGNDIPWPTVDDTANKGKLVAENAAFTNTDVVFGQKTLKAYKYTSDYIPVSLELLQDSFFPIQDFLRGLLVERIGRITNDHFTTGDNSSKPEGVVVGAGSGFVAPNGTSQVTAILAQNVMEIEHSVDPLYRPNARWMFNDSTLKKLRQLRDDSGASAGTGNFLFRPGFDTGAPNTILGYPYVINQSMASMGASAKSILFGDFKRYIVRDVLPISLVRLDELHALNGQVSFVAISRHDGRILNSNAVKFFQNAAS
jgi:HK97 family phage major capsid protein